MVRPGRSVEDSVDLKRRVFSLPALVTLALAVAFLVFLVTRFDVDLHTAWSLVRESNPWFLTAAVGVHYSNFLFRGARWRLLLQNTLGRSGSVPGTLYCSQLVFLGWFVNAVGWLRLGDAYRAYLYKEEQRASFSSAIGTILAERTLDALLVVLLLVAAVPFLVKGNGGPVWTVLGVAVALVILLLLLLAVMAWGRGWALGRLPEWISGIYLRFHEGTVGSFQRILPVTLWGLLGWLAEVARLYLVVKALDFDLGVSTVIFLTLANSLLTLVPTPGGFGAVESGVAGLTVRLSALTVSGAAALVLVDRSISYVSIIFVGGLIFLWRQLLRRHHPASQYPGVVEDQRG